MICPYDDDMSRCSRVSTVRAHKQLFEIYDYKWYRSEENDGDIGEERAAREWIPQYAKKFSAHWKVIEKQIKDYEWDASKKEQDNIGLHRALREWLRENDPRMYQWYKKRYPTDH